MQRGRPGVEPLAPCPSNGWCSSAGSFYGACTRGTVALRLSKAHERSLGKESQSGSKVLPCDGPPQPGLGPRPASPPSSARTPHPPALSLGHEAARSAILRPGRGASLRRRCPLRSVADGEVRGGGARGAVRRRDVREVGDVELRLRGRPPVTARDASERGAHGC